MAFWDWWSKKEEEEFCDGCNFEIREGEELYKRKDGKYYCSQCKEQFLPKK